jgi:hypothetical protein
MDPDAFARQVAAGDRGRRGPRRENGGSPMVAVPVMGVGADGPAPVLAESMSIPRVSPLRGSQPEGTLTIEIGVPMGRRSSGVASLAPRAAVAVVDGGVPEPASLQPLADEGSEEPPLPEEVGAALGRAAATSTTPIEAGPGQVLHIRFAVAPDERIVAAFAELRSLIRERPGGTPVVLHVPAGPGRTREMRLGSGIAYDAELLAEVHRRLAGLVRLEVA